MAISNQVINECKKKLLLMKAELLNRFKNSVTELSLQEKASGDEIDQSVAYLAETNFLIEQNRIRIQLAEIEHALARISSGGYGICEETFEPIEEERLLALPFTRLSIEGSEIRETLSKKYAR